MNWNRQELTKSSFFRLFSTKFDKIKRYNIVRFEKGDKMNLSIIEDIILNLILIVFPLLIYLVLVCYQDSTNIKRKKILLNIALFTSLYLCLKFGIIENNNKILLFCNIPIVIAYMKKQTYTGINYQW